MIECNIKSNTNAMFVTHVNTANDMQNTFEGLLALMRSVKAVNVFII